MGNKMKQDKKQMCLADVESHIRKAQSSIQELLTAARQLPKIEKDGSSECPFAKELYEKKEEAQKHAVSCQQQLYECLQWVQEQIQGCSNDLAVISAHQSQLHKDQPRDHYSDAEGKLAAQYNKLVKLKEEIEKTIEEIQKAIIEASQKQYPGKNSQASMSFPKSDTQSFDHPSGVSDAGQNRQLKEMLLKGPIE